MVVDANKQFTAYDDSLQHMHRCVQYLIHTLLSLHDGKPKLLGAFRHRVLDDISLSDRPELPKVLGEIHVGGFERDSTHENLLVGVLFELLRLLIFLEGIVAIYQPSVDDVVRAQDTLVGAHIVAGDEAIALRDRSISVSYDQDIEHETELREVVHDVRLRRLYRQSADEQLKHLLSRAGVHADLSE